MPFFKGGLALTLAYYTGVFLALIRGFRRRFEPKAAAAFFIVLLYVVFLAQEGWFMMSISFDLALVGLCLGHLLARGGEGAPLRFRRAAA
jgi:energy-coupling factor transporter transmembrane protein EcfT